MEVSSRFHAHGSSRHRLLIVALLLAAGGCVGTKPRSLDVKPPDLEFAGVNRSRPLANQPQVSPPVADEPFRLPPVECSFRGLAPSRVVLASHEAIGNVGVAAGHGPGGDSAHADSSDPSVELVPPGAPLPPKAGLAQPRRFLPQVDQTETYPIDLANALALGGANNLQIQLARQQVLEAQADWQKAHTLWLPSLWYGVGYNKHDGRIQATEGEVIEAGRNSLFVGGGAGLGSASLAGGANGPSRLVANLSLADVAFEHMVARQVVDARGAIAAATVNDTLARVSVAYFDLLEAQAAVANNRAGQAAAAEMVRLTRLLAEEGKTARGEVQRAAAEQEFWEREVEDARRAVIVRSAELARLIRLAPTLRLMPVEERLAPVDLVGATDNLDTLVATGLSARPEFAELQSLADASATRVSQETWRPLLPYVQVGASGGSFGGGPSAQYTNDGGRGDVDLLAVWEVRNLGLGNLALRRQRISQFEQAATRLEILRDRVVAEVVASAADVDSYGRQIDTTLAGVAAASASYDANLERIRAGEGLPIELLQAIRARTDAQNAHTRAISNYNRAQARLLRAVGNRPVAPTP